MTSAQIFNAICCYIIYIYIQYIFILIYFSFLPQPYSCTFTVLDQAWLHEIRLLDQKC